MKKLVIWWGAGAIFVLVSIFLIPEANTYLTKKNYESEEVTPEDVPDGYEVATFAGGCFWCMEPPFEKLKGISEVVPGYTGGGRYSQPNPTYKEISPGGTGHVEAVQVYYDPTLISYDQLLDVFLEAN